MHKKLISTPNGRTYYWISGKGNECIVFIHGATADHALFNKQFDFFNSNFKILTLDVAAHGLSKPYSNFNLKEASETLIQILDIETISKAHLVGQSMGGYISQIVAKNWSDRVSSITIIGSSPLQPQYYSKLDNWLLKITPWILKITPYNFLVKSMSNHVSKTDDGKKYMLEVLKRHSKNEIVFILKEVYVEVMGYRENSIIDIPILITYGEFDNTGKVKHYCKKWAENEKRQLQVIPNSAHNANMDNPEHFNKILSAFLNDL